MSKTKTPEKKRYAIYAIGALVAALLLCLVCNKAMRKSERYKQYEASHEDSRMIRVRPAGGPPSPDRAARVAPEPGF